MLDINDTIDMSDSDDDLLGINDNPINIRTFSHKSRCYSHQPPTITKFTERTPPFSSKIKYFKSKQGNSHMSRQEMNMGIPYRSADEKIARYQRMREVKNVVGFIVNVHDATNFDIDLHIPTELHERYRDVISNQYTYKDLDSDFLENPNINRIIEIIPEIGTTYRCRLRGVGINQLSPAMHMWKSNQMCIEVKQLIDRTDGWVVCCLSDIDVYQRLLVDVIVNTSNGPINLKEYLLSKMIDDDNPIFYPYSGKRHTIHSKYEIQRSCIHNGISDSKTPDDKLSIDP